MAAGQPNTESGPVRESARITGLDLIRGVAVLGILLMNAVSFKFGLPPYLNLSAGGSETWLDWAWASSVKFSSTRSSWDCSRCS